MTTPNPHPQGLLELAWAALTKKRWTLRRRAIESDPFGKTIPAWASHLGIGGFREQGWAAYDQRQNGKTVATGKWGDQLWIGIDGTVRCTEYPNGYARALAQKEPGNGQG